MRRKEEKVLKLKEEFVEIKGYNFYQISNYGRVISFKSGQKRELHPFLDSKKRYFMIKLLDANNQRKAFLIHRLVAMHFITNPNELPEVNHKDRNTRNNISTNLEWCTRKYNLEFSNITSSPVKNKINCSLHTPYGYDLYFDSIIDACRYAAEKYNVSYQSLYKYHIIKDTNISVKPVRTVSGTYCRKSRTVFNKDRCKLFIDDNYIASFPSNRAAAIFAKEKYGAKQYILEKYFVNGNIRIVPISHNKRKQYSNCKIGKSATTIS